MIIPYTGTTMTQENHYVYHRRSAATLRKATLTGDEQASYDSDDECEEKPYGACFELKDRLVHTKGNKKVKHSTHRHPLLSYKMLKEDKAVCNICEIDIIGLAYGCDQGCEFIIHKSCLHTPVTIQHWSHKDHPLTLLAATEYVLGFVECNACCDMCKSYHYHCSTCECDLHVACAGLPQTVQNNHHRYPLTLFSGKPIEIEDKKTINCSFCHDVIVLKGWVYYNKDSEFVAHLDCAFTEEIEESVLGIEERLLSLKVAT